MKITVPRLKKNAHTHNHTTIFVHFPVDQCVNEWFLLYLFLYLIQAFLKISILIESKNITS